MITVQQQSAESYVEQLADAHAWLAREAAESGNGRLLPIHLTPYISGLPYRIGAIEALLRDLARPQPSPFKTGSQIVDAWTSAERAV